MKRIPSRPAQTATTVRRFDGLAKDLVTGAMAASFHDDPVIGTELSRPFSIASSAICRHGIAVQSVISDVLAADGRFEVLRNQPLPITRTASELASSRMSPANLKKITLRADASVARIVNIDLVVIDEAAGWIGAFDVKRGAGPTASAKRKALERDLVALRLSLQSWARQLGYDTVDKVTTGVLDYYGKAGFLSDLTISKTEFDELFAIPISTQVDEMTAAVSETLHKALPKLFGPAEQKVEPRAKPTAKTGPKPAVKPASKSVGNPVVKSGTKSGSKSASKSAPKSVTKPEPAAVISLFGPDGRLKIARPFGPGGPKALR